MIYHIIVLDAKVMEEYNEAEGIMLSLFLDFLMQDAIKNPDKLVVYTQEMSAEIDDLLVDVALD